MFNRILLVLLTLGAFLTACTPSAPVDSSKPLVVCTIFAYYDAARAIAGPDARALILLSPGKSPHEFEPSKRDKDSADAAKLIIKNGLGLDDWINLLAADNKSAKILSIGDTLQTLITKEESLNPTTQQSLSLATERNPHVWLDPMNQIKAAEQIRDALDNLDPAHKSGYDQRTAAYIADLQKLDADFKATTATFSHKDFIGFHSAYDYLAHRYGLNQAAALEEIGTGGISPAQLQHIIQLIKDRHIPVVFSETAFDASQAEVVTRETGVKLGTLQPLETYDNINDTYVSLMHKTSKK